MFPWGKCPDITARYAGSGEFPSVAAISLEAGRSKIGDLRKDMTGPILKLPESIYHNDNIVNDKNKG
jgi:hypothetical protein